MSNLQPGTHAGKAGPPVDGPRASSAPRDRTKPGGFVAATDDFLDVRSEPEKSRLTSVEARLFQNIELFARESCFAFPSTATLAKRTGRTTRAVKFILDQLQAKGWILPVL